MEGTLGDEGDACGTDGVVSRSKGIEALALSRSRNEFRPDTLSRMSSASIGGGSDTARGARRHEIKYAMRVNSNNKLTVKEVAEEVVKHQAKTGHRPSHALCQVLLEGALRVV